MCGIFGILNTNDYLQAKRFGLPNKVEVLRHRGPDEYGYYLDSKIFLGHRRLSIIDLKSGKQPIFNEDGTKCIVFNGEIYNFKELRSDLQKRGHHFITNSDTEAIIHCYEEWGIDCVNKFRGMFAFAIWDKKFRKLFIARDRLGIKPLFYAFHEGIFYFSSEIKAILQYQNFEREINPDGLASFFIFSYILAPNTIFKNIFKLLPGHSIEVEDGQIQISKYWDLYFESNSSKSERYFCDRFMGILEESVKLRMISDVPVGAFVSGGVDSGVIVALMSKVSTEPVRSFCIGFGGETGNHLDERVYAQQIAQKFNTIHQEYEVNPNFQEIMEEIVKSFDEPFADKAIVPSYYLSKIARESVKVALSGLGGDELFGGYPRYQGFRLSTLLDNIPSFLTDNLFKKIINKIPERTDGHYTVNHLKRFFYAVSFPPDQRYLSYSSMLNEKNQKHLFSNSDMYKESFLNIKELFLKYYKAPNATEPLNKIFYTDIKTWLPDDILTCTDRTSMWHGLEVRVPFLDHKLVEFCATIPPEMKVKLFKNKYILKLAFSDILPKSVLKHRKQGFVGPMAKWFQSELKTYSLETLSERNLRKHNIFNEQVVKRLLNEHFSRVEMNEKVIWSLIVFQNWYNLYIEKNYPISLS